MKNRRLLVVGIPLIFCMAFAGCDTGNGTPLNEEPKSIIITGVSGDDIPDEYGSIRIRVLYGRGISVAGQDQLQIDDASKTLTTPLVLVEQNDSILPGSPAWTGNGKHYIAIFFGDLATFVYTGDGDDSAQYNFDSAVTSIAFSQFRKQP
jgi:hypothetical protein